MISDVQRDNMRAWIEDLRSDKYEQCTGRLHTSEGFCCLGVAVDRFSNLPWRLHYTNLVGIETFAVRFPADSDYNEYLLPDYDWMRDTFGIKDSDIDTVSTMNDNGATFAEIADYLQEKYLD